MDTFSPEFSAFWLGESEQTGARPVIDAAPGDEALSPAQQVALEELVDWVNAARSVV